MLPRGGNCMPRFIAGCALALVLICPGWAQSQSNTEPPAESQKATKQKSSEKPARSSEQKPPAPMTDEEKKEAQKETPGEKEEHFDVSEVPPVVTHHQTTVDGKLLKYTATAGRLPIKRGDGKIEAAMFFVAYTLDAEDTRTRPLTFAFNGGPGS